MQKYHCIWVTWLDGRWEEVKLDMLKPGKSRLTAPRVAHWIFYACWNWPVDFGALFERIAPNFFFPFFFFFFSLCLYVHPHDTIFHCTILFDTCQFNQRPFFTFCDNVENFSRKHVLWIKWFCVLKKIRFLVRRVYNVKNSAWKLQYRYWIF